MYVSNDGSQILSDDMSMYPDLYFQCDSLMCPIISLLNKIGYKTRASCQGHIYTHYLESNSPNYPDTAPCEDFDSICYDEPYIMFESSVKDIILDIDSIKIPSPWDVEYNIIRDERLLLDSYINPDENILEFIKNQKDPYFIILRLNLDSYNFLKDSDPYEFYLSINMEIRKLWYFIRSHFVPMY